MGAGKSTAMFRMMGEGFAKEGKRYMYISLFIAEVGGIDGGVTTLGRVHEVLPEMDFKMPKSLYTTGKVGGLKPLLKEGYNISTTHATFQRFDIETIQLLIDGKYTLIIDEAVDCINEYKEYNKGNFNILLESGRVVLEDDKFVWVGESVDKECAFYDIMKLCKTESLYKYKEEIIMWEYPPNLLRMLDDVYVVTYLFKGSIMWSWMKKNNIEFKWVPNNIIGLTRTEDEIKSYVRENLEILNSNSLNKLRGSRKGRENQFSAAWYKRAAAEEDKSTFKTIVKIIESTVSRTKTKSGSVFWTTFKDYKNVLAGKGYRKPPKDGLKSWLPYTQKAINDYREHSLCVFGVDIHKTTLEVNYLNSRGIDFDRDTYSNSCMLQFIWRGNIRQVDGKMKVLILSERMEELLRGWLNE